jgi:hypothetical protein
MVKVFIPTIIILSVVLFIQVKFTVDSQNETKIYKAKCDSLQHVSDSLYWELLPTQIELGRREVAYDILMERNPKAAKQYGDIISNETE